MKKRDTSKEQLKTQAMLLTLILVTIPKGKEPTMDPKEERKIEIETQSGSTPPGTVLSMAALEKNSLNLLIDISKMTVNCPKYSIGIMLK